MEKNFFFRNMVDSADIWQEAFRHLIDDISSADFPASVDKQKLKKAVYLTGNVINGSYKEEDDKKLQSLKLNTDEYIYLTDITSLLLRTKNYSESLNLEKNNFVFDIANSAIKSLKEEGMKLDGIMTILRDVQIHEEVFTAHPTYNGSPKYTNNVINYFTALADFSKARNDITEKQLTDTVHKLILDHSVRKEDMTVDEESEFNLNHLRNAKLSTAKVYNAFDRALKENFGNEYDDKHRRDLKINIIFRAWGVGGGDKDGNQNVIESNTLTGIKKDISMMIDDYHDAFLVLRNMAQANNIESDKTKLDNTIKVLDSLRSSVNSVDRVSVIQHSINEVCKDIESHLTSIFMKESNPSEYKEKALETRRFVKDFKMRLAEIEFRDTAENNIHILKNIIPSDEIFKHLPRDHFVDSSQIKSYEDLANLRNINVTNFRHEIESILESENHKREDDIGLKSCEDIEKLVKFPEAEFKKEFFKLSLKDQKIYSIIENKITSEVRDQLISPIISDRDRYPRSLVRTWCEDSLKALEVDMDANPALAEEVKARGYKNADYSHFYNAVKREAHVAGTDMCSTRVLAEATSALEYKEEILFLRSVGNETKKIILLFEEPEILKPNKLKKNIRDIISDPEIFKHLARSGFEDVKNRKGIEISDEIKEALYSIKPVRKNEEGYAEFKESLRAVDKQLQEFSQGKVGLKNVLTFEIQLAHSDNTRRAGLLAARSLIYEGHRIIRGVCKEFEVRARFFEGCSITDSLRGGLRAVASMFNLYNNHEFSKLTIQGIDVAVTYGNTTRGALHLADIVADSLKSLSKNRGLITPKELDAQKQAYEVGKIIERDLKLNSRLSNQVDRYVNEYFLNDSLPYTIAQIYESADDKHANRASRKARKNVEANPYYKHPDFDRTIIYSERGQQKGDNYGYIGAGALSEVVDRAIKDIKNIGEIKIKSLDEDKRKVVADYFAGKSDQQITQDLFKICPYLNEVRDRMAFALASTDFELIWSKAVEKNIIYDKNGDELERIKKRPSHGELEGLATLKNSSKPSVVGMLAWKEQEFRKTAAVIYTAFTGKDVDLAKVSTEELRNLMKKSLDEKYLTIVKINDSANFMMKQLKTAAEKELDAEKSSTLKDLMHNFKDFCLFPSESIKSLLAMKIEKSIS